jgi:hypothetical protein
MYNNNNNNNNNNNLKRGRFQYHISQLSKADVEIFGHFIHSDDVDMRFEFLTAVTMKVTIFEDVTPCIRVYSMFADLLEECSCLFFFLPKRQQALPVYMASYPRKEHI